MFIVCLAAVVPAPAATGRVIKVLPQLLDWQGRNSLAPSLYERDAYQAYLRQHTNQISGLQFVVEWKAKGTTSAPLTLRVEARGITHGNLPTEMLIEKPARAGGWFGNWTTLFLLGDDYKNLGQVTAWRVTLWEGPQQLGEQRSFLW